MVRLLQRREIRPFHNAPYTTNTTTTLWHAGARRIRSNHSGEKRRACHAATDCGCPQRAGCDAWPRFVEHCLAISSRSNRSAAVATSWLRGTPVSSNGASSTKLCVAHDGTQVAHLSRSADVSSAGAAASVLIKCLAASNSKKITAA